MDSIIRLALASCSAARISGTATVFKVKSPGIVQVHGFASLARRRKGRARSRLPRRPLFDIIPAMKMHPSHRPCLLALAALPARSRTIDLRGNVTHTGNLGSVPNRWLGGSVVRWLGSCANPQPETHTSRPENDGLVPKAPILKYRIILGEQANIMQIACAVARSVPKFSDRQSRHG